jgi:hypothetical protein
VGAMPWGPVNVALLVVIVVLLLFVPVPLAGR